jgi:hypothetical protein
MRQLLAFMLLFTFSAVTIHTSLVVIDRNVTHECADSEYEDSQEEEEKKHAEKEEFTIALTIITIQIPDSTQWMECQYEFSIHLPPPEQTFV